MNFCKYFKNYTSYYTFVNIQSEISVIVQYIWLSIPNNYWNSVKCSSSHDNSLDLFLCLILNWNSEFPKLTGVSKLKQIHAKSHFPNLQHTGKLPTVISRARRKQNKCKVAHLCTEPGLTRLLQRFPPLCLLTEKIRLLHKIFSSPWGHIQRRKEATWGTPWWSQRVPQSQSLQETWKTTPRLQL